MTYMSSTATRQITESDLYLHGAKSICRNCGEHDSKHTSQFVAMYGYRAMVCPSTDHSEIEHRAGACCTDRGL